MNQRSGIVSVLLVVVVAVAGCRAEEPAGGAAEPSASVATSAAVAAPPSASASAPTSAPVVEPSLPPPLRAGPFEADPWAVRDALLEEIEAAGGVHVRVAPGPPGGPHQVDFDVQYLAGRASPLADRITWRQDGSSREALVLDGGQVCLNRAEARTLEARADQVYSDPVDNLDVEGTVAASDRPYSCSVPGHPLGLGAFVARDLLLVDPVTRLASLGGDTTLLHLTDLGLETATSAGATRHLRLAFEETDTAERRIPTTYDLWVDGDLRLVRAELSNLHWGAGRIAASFTYGGVPPVALPDAVDRGPLTFHQTAPQGTVSRSDPSGDVDARRPRHWLVPSLDLTEVEVSFQAASKRLLFRIEVADLRELRHHRGRFAETVTVSRDSAPGYLEISFGRGADRGVYLADLPGHPHFGARVRRCPGAWTAVDMAADTMLLSLPIRCIAPTGRAARFTVRTRAEQESAPRGLIGSDVLHVAGLVRTR